MDKDFEKRFIAAANKGLSDEMIAEQLDIAIEEVKHYRRLLQPESEREEEEDSAS